MGKNKSFVHNLLKYLLINIKKEGFSPSFLSAYSIIT